MPGQSARKVKDCLLPLPALDQPATRIVLCVRALSGRSVGSCGGTGQDLCNSGFYPPMSFYAGDRFQSSIHSVVVGSLSILFLPFADGHLDLCNGFCNEECE